MKPSIFRPHALLPFPLLSTSPPFSISDAPCYGPSGSSDLSAPIAFVADAIKMVISIPFLDRFDARVRAVYVSPCDQPICCTFTIFLIPIVPWFLIYSISDLISRLASLFDFIWLGFGCEASCLFLWRLDCWGSDR